MLKKMSLFLVAVLTVLSVGSAASAATLTTGSYTAAVSYEKYDTSSSADAPTGTGEASMIQTDGIWSTNIGVTVNSLGQATVKLHQNKYMGLMSYVKFDGSTMTSSNVDSVAGTGDWTVKLSKTQTAKLQNGAKILAEMNYTVTGLFTHTESVLININSGLK
ncbi:MAG TPA: hypothetical protein VGM95_06565 [Lactobacillaceae bacterium]